MRDRAFIGLFDAGFNSLCRKLRMATNRAASAQAQRLALKAHDSRGAATESPSRSPGRPDPQRPAPSAAGRQTTVIASSAGPAPAETLARTSIIKIAHHGRRLARFRFGVTGPPSATLAVLRLPTAVDIRWLASFSSTSASAMLTVSYLRRM